MNIIGFNNIRNADLVKGYTYKGGEVNNLSSEPISKLLPVGNQSGIRFTGTTELPIMVVLYSTFSDNDWPDHIDDDVLFYYRDNKAPGREIHETPGNKIFKETYNNLHLNKKEAIPPIFLFSKGTTGFDRVFKGLLVPGNFKYTEMEDLIAIWKTKENQKFQNYKAVFTLLPTQIISRTWINDIINGNKLSLNAPEEWKQWIEK